MRRLHKLALLLSFSLVVFLGSFNFVSAANCDDISCNKDDDANYLRCIEEKTSCWVEKIEEAQASAVTLKSTINILNGQINVLQLQIDQSLTEITSLEKEIIELTDRIEGLNYSLDKLTSVLVERVAEQYKRTYTNPILVFFSKTRFSTKLSEFKYLKLAGQQTVNAMERAESQKITYDEQKLLKKQKQDELESKRVQLEGQKGQLAGKRVAEQNLLTQTKNNEAVFQQKLAEAKAEFQAIQAIIAGRGQETEVGQVNKGDKIASVIQGASCNSSGAHVHLIVSDFGVVKNPFNYLKSGIDYQNCSGSSCGSSDGDSFNPSGSWDWPIAATVQLWQGYGSTWATRNTWVSRIYSSHNGIDIRSLGSQDVKAMQSGTLYQGSFTGSGSCRLRYVRVAHNDSEISSFYLHINY
jgi:peptidoglycan hydrolase CwlO-like protein